MLTQLCGTMLVVSVTTRTLTCSEYYARAVSEFTVQMTVHPVGPTTTAGGGSGAAQTLISKENEWKLLINGDGRYRLPHQ